MNSSSSSRRVDLSLHEALLALTKAGARVFCVLPEDEALRLPDAARRLGVSVDWMRDHLSEFPNVFRLPAGEIKTRTGGRNIGELRFPASDITAFQQRQRLPRVEVEA